MKKKSGQVEFAHLLSVGGLTIVFSLVGSLSLGAYNYGKLTEQVDNIDTTVTAQQVKVDKIPTLEDKLIWVMERLDQIADKIGAPAAKE